MSAYRALISVGLLLAVAGCREDEPVEAPPTARPVLAVVANATPSNIAGFAGTIEPRHQTSLGFRMLGRVVEQNASLGARVRKGDVLARLDAVALELAVRAAEAELTVAEARFANAEASAGRMRALSRRDVAAKVQVELTAEASDTAAALLADARARLAKAKEQLGYARLIAEFDGIVTDIRTEVGEVVSPGLPVVTIARADMSEAVVDVPDQLAATFSVGDPFEVALQANDAIVAVGTLREIAPEADAATRSRRLRISLGNAAGGFRLGTTVTATPRSSTVSRIELPASGLVESGGKTLVWVIDPQTSKVSLHAVKLASRTGSRIEVAEGLADGSRVVVAGVHSLKPGQLVRISEE